MILSMTLACHTVQAKDMYKRSLKDNEKYDLQK
jgi:hypothetical protein